MVRRVGLSKNQKPQPLLSQIRGYDERQPRKPAIDDDAPPQSTDDEDNGDDTRLNQSLVEKASVPLASGGNHGFTSSEDEVEDRAAISRTKFLPSGQGNVLRKRASSTKSEHEATGKAADSPPASRGPEAKRLKLPGKYYAARKGTTNSSKDDHSPKALPTSGSHLKDDMGFVALKKSKTTYGKKYKSSQELSSQEPAPARSRKLRAVDDDKHSAKPKGARLRDPGPSITSPPSKSSKFRAVSQGFDDLLKSPSSKKTLKLVERPSPSSDSTAAKAKVSKYSKSKREPSRTPSPPRAVFKMPSALPGGNNDAVFQTVSTTAAIFDDESSCESTNNTPVVNRVNPIVSAPTCPWCGESVDKELLQKFSKGKRMNVTMQTKFCQEHKKQTARERYQEKQYPRVDWVGLEKRFAPHRHLLLNIINGESSHFRNILANNIESGKNRHLKADDNLNPGYYGPRGFLVMSEYLVSEFGHLLKQRAVSDRVISGRGSVAFIQSVLVAELAVRLIMEDMDVLTEEARSILEESKTIGALVHGEA